MSKMICRVLVLLCLICFPSQTATGNDRPNKSHKHKITYTKHCDETPPYGFDRMIEAAGIRYKINPRILATTVYLESGCNSRKLGAAGEIGLMQVNPSVWKDELREELHISVKDLWNPNMNVMAGAYVMYRLRPRAQNIKELFRLYNGSGPMARNYASKQMKNYRTVWGRNPTFEI